MALFEPKYIAGLSFTLKLFLNKIKLLDERKFLPALALGIADFGGTGAYAGEYLVASKRIKDFDFTAGIGWGRLAGSRDIDNPVGDILGDKWLRRGGHFSLGGKLNLGNSFSGPYAGVFGGVEYFTPIDGLSIKLEYDSNDYSDAEGKSINVLFPDPLDNEGPNLFAIVEMLGIRDNVVFSNNRVDFQTMNVLHNLSDVVINITQNG